MSAHQNEISRARRPESLQKECDQILQNHYKEVDRFHVERLSQRYHDLVPADRIRAVKDLPTAFEDRKHFEQSGQKAGVEIVDSHNNRTVGFSRRTLEPAHVDIDCPQWRKTAIHERLHQLSDPGSDQLLGKGMNEGVTEDLAIKEMGQDWNPELPRSYPRERAAAHKLRELCGDRAVDRAYFQGDTHELRVCLDERLGKGNLDKLKDMEDRPSEQGPEEARDVTYG